MTNVSIIIPCYNAAAWLRETLASAFAQGEAQVIVVDDGSTDESAEMVAREFPRAELIRIDNGGASQARNRGLEMARGEWIQFLDADDVLRPEKIARQRACLEKSNADIAYSDWQYLARANDSPFAPAQIVAREMEGAPDIALFTNFWTPMCAYLFRRRIVDAVGGFEVTLPILQDAHFVLACALRGARFEYVSGVSSLYRVHPAQISRNRVSFVRDGWAQSQLVQAWWDAHGGITAERRAALIQVYANLARTSYEIERAIFWNAYYALLKWEPRYAPAAPRSLNLLSRAVGYPRAEAVARMYRQTKRTALALLGRAPVQPIHTNVPR